MLLSLPSHNNNSLDTSSTYTLSPDGQQKSFRRRSFWRSGHSQLLASLRRKRSNAPSEDTASLSTSTSTCVSSSCPNSAASSFINLSDNELTTPDNNNTSLAEEDSLVTTPSNHPPPHVFGKGDQGYSMFYLKLPNGNWMVRCRTADRKIIATYEVDGSMI
ncbi:hypothetical protein BC941DRAFT_444057 [Chlamydoabsidia padenii]|nr:hypothetical protein BC941DRAFT_444057 [Chlamydoabsidia padenii]